MCRGASWPEYMVEKECERYPLLTFEIEGQKSRLVRVAIDA